MALSSVISKSSSAASSSVVSVAVRAISCAGSLHGSASASVTDALKAGLEQPMRVDGSRLFSTVDNAKKFTDKSLLRVLRSEIKAAKIYDQVNRREFPHAPSSFPLTIKDNSRERFITLTRGFPDETIEIIVRQAEAVEVVEEELDYFSENDSDDDNKDSSEAKNSNVTDKSDSSSDDNTSSEEEDSDDNVEDKKVAWCLPMSMTIRRFNGKSLKVELTASLDEIKVKQMSFEERVQLDDPGTILEFSGPDFEQFDEDFRYSFMKYLEIRGIKSNYIEFLHKYMAAKSPKDDLLWMRELKQFIKN